MTVRIWRLYPNGDLTEQTHVLWPHEDTRTMLPYDDGKRVGYNGDVEAWSNANMSTRPGCCQIVMHPGEDPEVVYNGAASEDTQRAAPDSIKTKLLNDTV